MERMVIQSVFRVQLRCKVDLTNIVCNHNNHAINRAAFVCLSVCLSVCLFPYSSEVL